MNEYKSAIDEATSVLLVLPGNALDKDYLAALQLQKLAPEKTHIIASEEKEAVWEDVFGAPSGKKEFSIVVDTEVSPVEELRYEKDEHRLVIYLSHKHRFDKNAIHFEEHIPSADLIISVGFPSQKEAERFIESFPRKGSVRHMWLPESGTDKLGTSAIGLLGRLLARAREDVEAGVLWSFISHDDFSKTSLRPGTIPGLIAILQKIILLPRLVVIFWQSQEDEGVDGIIWTSDPARLAEIAGRFGEIISNHEFISLPRYLNFIEAETEVRKLLRGIE